MPGGLGTVVGREREHDEVPGADGDLVLLRHLRDDVVECCDARALAGLPDLTILSEVADEGDPTVAHAWVSFRGSRFQVTGRAEKAGIRAAPRCGRTAGRGRSRLEASEPAGGRTSGDLEESPVSA